MRTIQFSIITLILPLLLLTSCNQAKQQADPLPSWNNTAIKTSILKYVDSAVSTIPVEDRIAVFDMDGTIACETPLWDEMYAAVDGLNKQSAKNQALLKYPEYIYAKKLAINPGDTTVTNHWVTKNANYVDSMVWKAYAGVDHEV